MRQLRIAALPLLLALGLVVAGCGGSSPKTVPADAIALVGSDTITKAQFNDLMAAAKRTYKARKTPFPKVGTTAYKSLEDQAVTYLVQEVELEQKGKTLGITVTPKDIQSRIDQIKKQYFGGDEKKYQAQLKAQGLTESQLRLDLKGQILSERLYAKVTADTKITNAEVKAYYNQNKSQYTTAESRDVRHILVNDKATAEKLEAQLKAGADFGALAKKYSKDTGSAQQGGKLTITKGQTVPAFDKEAFALKTNAISPPIHTQYGWHIIQALSPVKPANQTPFASVQAQIRQNLLSTKKNDEMTAWVDALKKEYASKVVYQAGYAPATTAATDTTSTATTG